MLLSAAFPYGEGAAAENAQWHPSRDGAWGAVFDYGALFRDGTHRVCIAVAVRTDDYVNRKTRALVRFARYVVEVR